jgi:hypothetical protein
MFATKLVAPVLALTLSALSAQSQFLEPATLADIATSKPLPRLTSSKVEAPKSKSKGPDKLEVHPFSTFAIGVKVSTLGTGAEIATPLARSWNLRGTANFAQFRYNFTLDGISYNTGVNLRSGQINADWFPFHGGFHISPGVLYFRNGLSGSASVQPARSFSLDSVNYINSVDDPVHGTASFVFQRHLAPMVLFGFSNIIPRDSTHISVPFEFGIAYTEAPVVAVQLNGTACTHQGCFNAGTDPSTQKNLKQQLHDVRDSANKFPVYPIASLGFAFRF